MHKVDTAVPASWLLAGSIYLEQAAPRPRMSGTCEHGLFGCRWCPPPLPVLNLDEQIEAAVATCENCALWGQGSCRLHRKAVTQ